MAQSITRKAIAYVSKSIAPRMKDAAFRPRANHFHRHLGDLIHGVNFQASQWGASQEGSFTINLVVTSDWLYRAWSGRELPANPATALFPVQQRIGSLLPEHRDLWWKIADATDVGLLSREVEEAIVHYALPFFDTFSGLDAILERIRSSHGLPGLTAPQVPLVHAIIAARAGLRTEAQAQLERAAHDAGDSPFAGTVRSVAQRLGFSGA